MHNGKTGVRRRAANGHLKRNELCSGLWIDRLIEPQKDRVIQFDKLQPVAGLCPCDGGAGSGKRPLGGTLQMQAGEGSRPFSHGDDKGCSVGKPRRGDESQSRRSHPPVLAGNRRFDLHHL